MPSPHTQRPWTRAMGRPPAARRWRAAPGSRLRVHHLCGDRPRRPCASLSPCQFIRAPPSWTARPCCSRWRSPTLIPLHDVNSGGSAQASASPRRLGPRKLSIWRPCNEAAKACDRYVKGNDLDRPLLTGKHGAQVAHAPQIAARESGLRRIAQHGRRNIPFAALERSEGRRVDHAMRAVNAEPGQGHSCCRQQRCKAPQPQEPGGRGRNGHAARLSRAPRPASLKDARRKTQLQPVGLNAAAALTRPNLAG